MTRITSFVEAQTAELVDFQNLAEDPRDAADLLVSTAIEAGMKYAGGGVAKTGVTTLSVARPLTLYKSGAIFSNDLAGSFEIDLISALPGSGLKRWVAVVAIGETIEDETEPRDFVVDKTADVYTYEARPTSTRRYRRSTVQTVNGTAAADPIKPTVDIGALVIGWVLLSSTEIISADNATTNRMKPLNEVEGRLAEAEANQALLLPQVAGLIGDIKKLAGTTSGPSSQAALIDYLLSSVARLNEQVGLAGTAGYARTNDFKDADHSDPGHTGYFASIDGGLTFADANMADMTPQLLNPADSNIVVHANGLVLPAYTTNVTVSNKGKVSEVPLSNAGATETTLVKKYATKTRLRYGYAYWPGYWWNGGWYDPYLGYWGVGEAYLWRHYYGYYYWYETYQEAYWSAVTEQVSYVGNVCAQTFAAPRSGWVPKVTIGFSRLDTAGDVTVAITETTTAGTPAYDKVIALVTVNRNDLVLYDQMSSIPIGPFYAEAGKRYAVVLITAGNHWVAMTDKNAYAGGTFFTSTDGAWAMGDLSKDMSFEIHYAEFAAPRVEAKLSTWNLDGGIAGIELTTEEIAPDGTSLVWQVQPQVAPLPDYETIEDRGTTDATPFDGTPAAMAPKLIFLGDRDMMPGIWLNRSKARLRRPRTDLVHFSDAYTALAACDTVKVTARVLGYKEADHSLDCTLLVGAGETPVAATATVDAVQGDGSLVREWTFSGFAAGTEFRIKLAGATAGPTSIFRVAFDTEIYTPAA